MTEQHTWQHPYEINPEYSKRTAYFSMEFGIDQALKIYSGGLGFLAGSHMKSAYSLKQNMIGVGMLWKFGYYDQVRNEERRFQSRFIKKNYSFLEDTGIVVPVYIHGHQVNVKAMYLPPHVFNTVPVYLLTTDIDENDDLGRAITNRLYDSNHNIRTAQQIVLGIGGAKVAEALGSADVYHMNEAHPLPLCFQLYNQFGSWEAVKQRTVFTTHTPEKAGNEENNIYYLGDSGYFGEIPVEEVQRATNQGQTFNHTAAALHLVRAANGVSEIHKNVARQMWGGLHNIPEIIGITNAQNKDFWTDQKLSKALEENKEDAFIARKRELKVRLFEEVADQCGKVFDPDALTIVWARRFAEYKRADLLLRDVERFNRLLENKERPVQVIWAGKPYPEDYGAISTFNHLIEFAEKKKNVAVLFGYEIKLSRMLKLGTDIWLNNPRRPREASGTSGMTAAKNAAVNLSVPDGWIPEFARHGENAFILPPADLNSPVSQQDDFDAQNIYRILEEEILSIFYDDKKRWWKIAKQSMKDVSPKFTSSRMADEYYKKLYS